MARYLETINRMKRDTSKTKADLIADLTEARRRIAELEAKEQAQESAEALLRSRTELFEALRQVSAEMARELDLDRLLGIILRRAAELLGAHSGILSLCDERTGMVIPRYWEGHGDWVRKLSLPLGRGISGTVAVQGTGMVINDYRKSPHIHPLVLEHTSVTSVVAEPLVYRDRIVGVVTVDNQGSPERTFTEADRKILMPFAVQAAIAIENARLFEAAQKELKERTHTERVLRENEQLYRTFIDSTPDMVFLKNERLTNIVVNRSLATFFGKTEGEIIGRTDFDLMPEAAAEGCRRSDLDALESGSIVTSEETIGDQVYETHKFPVPLGHGRTGVGGYIRNITARRESEALYKTLIETSPDPIVVYDLDGKILAVNMQTALIYGVPGPEAFLASVKTVFDLLTKEGRAEAALHFRRTLYEGQSQKNEYMVRSYSGEMIPMEINSSIIRDAGGAPKAFLSVLRDVTERKRSEIIMATQRDLGFALAGAITLQDALELCLSAAIKLTGFDAGGIYTIDTATGDLSLVCVRGVSASFAESVGHYDAGSHRAQFIKKGQPQYIENEDIHTMQRGAALIDEGIKSVAVVPIRSQARIVGNLNVASHVFERIPGYVRNALETIAGQIGTAIARAQSEEALRESEIKFRDLAEKSIVGIYLIQDEILTYVNAEFANTFGYTVEEMTGRLGLKDIIHPEDLHIVEDNIRRRVAGEFKSVRYQFRIWTKDGTVRHAEVFSSLTFYEGKPAIIGTLLDITDRLKTEEGLKQLSVAIEQAAEDIVITDTEGTIQYVNPAFEKITGYSREEVIGQNPRILKSGVHNKAFYENLWNTLKAGKIWNGRLTNRRKDGRLIELAATISPLVNKTGELTGYVALKRDITEAVMIESQLRQAQKMEAIGTLAGGIAHDFNNILGAMLGYAELAKYKSEDPEILTYLEQILTACDRARDLVQQILTFSRKTEQEKKPIMLIPLLKEVVKFIRASLPTTIAINQTLTATADTIMADATQIHQLLMNLCTNAWHAMKETGGILGIALSEIAIDDGTTLLPGLSPGRYLKLTVRDTGCGIPPEHLERIFEPYFTTKAKGEGTGLGLSVVDGIVRSHGGAVRVTSKVGKGSAFHVFLPLLDDQLREAGHYAAAEALPGGSERILFIDDEQMLADISKLTLTDLGYEVVVETDPAAALDVFRRKPGTFDLIITDKTMRRMTGFDLAREIRSIRTDIPIILCTGFQDRDDAEKIAALEIDRLVPKPVSIAVMAEAVRAVLDGRAILKTIS